jgi:hypothetical protein
MKKMKPPLHVTFDSNAWEVVFDGSERHPAILDAIREGRLRVYICAIAFQIEAVRKKDRPEYFASPHTSFVAPDQLPPKPGYVWIMSFGPDDAKHPGLPGIQFERLCTALSAGVMMLHGLAWMGLPRPRPLQDWNLYPSETPHQRGQRETLQGLINHQITERGVGKAIFEAEGGWQGLGMGHINVEKFQRACAEWADAEAVSAHVAYGLDVFCTNDQGRSAGNSVFNASNRQWLQQIHKVRFATLEELEAQLQSAA